MADVLEFFSFSITSFASSSFFFLLSCGKFTPRRRLTSCNLSLVRFTEVLVEYNFRFGLVHFFSFSTKVWHCSEMLYNDVVFFSFPPVPMRREKQRERERE
ncbi:Os05g0115100 [Oryza sativa Japonica Group]|uniref:Os05g0115100 protein n=2 Tax=Oryza sativa subsp. japonica TaxID=39947 RepID=Q65XA7_ORYSJ|nr:unknown protein [Oryza sativa Japonica Group]KAB8097832.1 hypothetical protein EE612_026676 [Oryza sativa]BAS91961.1 Os05g0115100 [Oryza sativa Japonica Group]